MPVVTADRVARSQPRPRPTSKRARRAGSHCAHAVASPSAWPRPSPSRWRRLRAGCAQAETRGIVIVPASAALRHPEVPWPEAEAPLYRPCVGIAVFNREGLRLPRTPPFRRAARPAHAWQMPQGGIDQGETPLRGGAARALRGDEHPLRLAARRERGLAHLRHPRRTLHARLEGPLSRAAAEMVRLPLRGRRKRDRRRGAGRRRAQAGIRRVALGAARARAGADHPLQALGLSSGGGGVRVRARRARRAASRARRSVGDDLHELSGLQRVARLEAVQKPEELQAAVRPLHRAAPGRRPCRPARTATTSILQRAQPRHFRRRHAAERGERRLQRLADGVAVRCDRRR